MSLATVRTALADAVDNTGLRSYDYLPGSPALPCAVVGWPTSFEPHAGFGDVPNMEIPVMIMVPFQGNRSADANLEQYLTTSGSLSVVAAIEAASAAYRVPVVRDFGVITIGDAGQLALACTVIVNVLA